MWAPLNALTFGSDGNGVATKKGNIEQKGLQIYFLFTHVCVEY